MMQVEAVGPIHTSKWIGDDRFLVNSPPGLRCSTGSIRRHSLSLSE